MKLTKKIGLNIFLFILLANFINLTTAGGYDWTSYGNGFTPLWQEQYTNAYGRFDIGITNITSLEGYNPTGTGSVQPLVSSMSSENTSYGTKNYVIFPSGNNLQIYDDTLTLIDEISVGGNIINQFAITDFDDDGLNNDVVGIFDISGNYKFRAYTYNFTTSLYELLNSTDLTSNSSDKILGIRCQGGNCYYLTVYPYNSTDYKANFTIINKTGIYESKLTLSGNDFNIPNAYVGNYKEPLSWYDFDNDGKDEWIAWTNKFIVMFKSDGTIEFNKINLYFAIRDVKPFHSQSGNNFWRIAVSTVDIYEEITVTAYKMDGSTLWTKIAYGLYGGLMAINDDYDHDYSKYDNEIYIGGFRPSSSYVSFVILKGYNGNILFTKTGWNIGTAHYLTSGIVTIADMNHNGYKDFIYQGGVYDPFIDTLLNPFSTSDISSNCVPADVNLDGFLEIICSNPSGSIIYSSTLENQNAYITSVIYNPSTIIQVNNSLVITISATDIESNIPFYYGIKCNDTTNWTADQTSPIFSCYYEELGTFTNIVRVRDQYHSTYDEFAQLINVTLTEAECNFNGICEAGIGENYITCLPDCPCNLNGICESGIGENYITCLADCPYTSPSPTGYEEITLPTNIVNVDNINEGLLPTIYFGILAFFNATLSPMIILIFLIFIVLIILAIGTIIKKIAMKVGS